MARNPIRFQKGMSLKELNQKYGTEEQCEAALTRWLRVVCVAVRATPRPCKSFKSAYAEG